MNTKLITPEYIRSIFINDIDVAGTMLHWFSKCSENDRKKLITILEDFAVNSQGRERDCSLFLLASESKEISNQLIDDLIKEIGDIYSEKESLVFTAIIMIRNCKRKDKLPFCKHVLEWSMLNKRIGIISIVIKCILVIGWKDSISEIVNYFMNEKDVRFLAHSMADFICEKGWAEFNDLKDSVPVELSKQIDENIVAIKDVLENKYMPIKKKE